MTKKIRSAQRSKRDRISTKVHDRIAMARVDAAIRTEQQWLDSAAQHIYSAIPGEIGMSGALIPA